MQKVETFNNGREFTVGVIVNKEGSVGSCLILTDPRVLRPKDPSDIYCWIAVFVCYFALEEKIPIEKSETPEYTLGMKKYNDLAYHQKWKYIT